MNRPQKIELLSLDAIIPYEHNARLHSSANIAKLSASIKEFGWTSPILVDEENAILAGHGRLLAARALLMPQVPCLRIGGLSSAQKHAYRLADNRLTLDSDWDLEMLALELQELGEFDLALTGFDPEELDKILGLDGQREGEDDAPPLEKEAVSKLGEIWALGAHRLICGDACNAAEVARLLSGVTPSVMVTDPPYGVDYDSTWRNDPALQVVGPGKSGDGIRAKGMMWRQRQTGRVDNDERSDWQEAYKSFKGNVVYVWHSGLHSAEVSAGLLAAEFEIRAQIIWVKHHLVFSRGHYHWQHEPCWYAVRTETKADWHGDQAQTTVWEIQNLNPIGGARNEPITGHSTQKPVECMRRPILNHTSSGQAVYDPFMGSGTTIIAAETTGRVCYGVEINPLYVDMAIRRWQTFTGKEATQASDGKTFTELEKLAH